MLRQFAKIATTQNILRKAIDLKDQGFKAIPQHRLMTGALAAKTVQETKRGLDLSKEHLQGFYPPGSYD